VRFAGHYRSVGPVELFFFMSPFWRLEFGDDSQVFGKFVDLWSIRQVLKFLSPGLFLILALQITLQLLVRKTAVVMNVRRMQLWCQRL
jgi:hypothetical protein